jgi:glycosyltransferase involved in cell wall biosynthesis
MGKTIIASNVDGTSEIIQHRENGWLVDTDDLVRNVSDALVSLSKDPALCATLGEAALRTVHQRYLADRMTRQIEQVYRDLLVRNGTSLPVSAKKVLG